jgi:radical SAM/Cys-rich protein
MMNGFEKKVRELTGKGLSTGKIDTLQVNVGLRCNQRCTHCHVDASPRRKELMTRETMRQVLAAARKMRPRLVDITGGAPELNPNLRWFVSALRKEGHAVQVRTNLTVLLEPGMEGMMRFYKNSGVKLVASFPCYMRPEVDNVRGRGVFDRSLEALERLNAVGYGTEKGLVLDLVFNPEKDFLPAPQADLEKEYREALGDLGISFNGLLTITNMPAGRFLKQLRRNGRERSYMRLLKGTFNPDTLGKLMCLSQIDVGWNGTVYDCDFNLARGLPARLPSSPLESASIGRYDPARDVKREVVTGEHCFGCTAGAGSSCGGALEK